MSFELIIVGLAVIIGFYMAWNIGANDVANAMGTSVGSGALTLKRAVIVAAVLEFAGAFLVGSSVTNTVRKGIVDPSLYVNTPNLFIFGMMAALLAAAVWLHIATFWGLPVSTTHSIVGSIIGFAIISHGFDAVNWVKTGNIVMSWVVSPVMGGALAFWMFWFIKTKILDSENPIHATRRISPFLVFLVFFILALVMLFKGLKQLKLDLALTDALAMATVIGIGFGFISWLFLKRFLQKKEDEVLASSEDHQKQRLAIVERVFIWLQILSACFVAFAHGANDVANAIGPLAAVISTVQDGIVGLKVGVPLWVLGLGGAGIVVGLATWGWRVIETIGKKITELTPTRGFAAEFGAATTIVIASKMGLPISTTHTLVGAVLGVGMARGVASMDTTVIRNIFFSWFITLPAGAGMTAIFYLLFKAVFA